MNAEKVAVFLAEKGTDVNSPIPGRGTPLLAAVQKGMGEVVRVLLMKGARVDITENGTRRSLLHLAAISGHGDIVEALLPRGIDVKAKDSRGKTALYYAAKHGNRKSAELIEAAGGLGKEEENFGPSPYLQKKMKECEANIWRLKDRGWAVKTRHHLQSDGIKFYYSGFPISPLEEHRKTLQYFKMQQQSCDMAFVALSGVGRPGDYEYLDQTLSILKPKVVFIHRPGPFSEDELKIKEMKHKHSVEIFHINADAGERFSYSSAGQKK